MLVKHGAVNAREEQRLEGRYLQGTVTDGKQQHQVDALIDGDERLAKGKCSCNFYQQNQLRQGPCEHILALRMAKSKPLSAVK